MLPDLSSLDHKKYLSGAMVIGIAQSIDSIIALAGMHNSVTTAFSLIELCWFLVSMLYFVSFYQKNFSIKLPLIYLIYYLFGWFYGSYLLSVVAADSGLIIPTWYMLFAGFFGIFYFSYSYYCYRIWRLT